MPVTIGGARVAPGDLVRGDADGVVVLPQAHEEEILEIAEQVEQAEEQIRALLDSGMGLKEAREQLQYHRLQSRRP